MVGIAPDLNLGRTREDSRNPIWGDGPYTVQGLPFGNFGGGVQVSADDCL